MNAENRAYLDMAGAMIIVGSVVVAGKIITISFPLFVAAALRFGIASLILVFLASHQDGGFGRIEPGDWTTLILMALSGQVVFTMCLLWGLRLTNASDAGIITSTTPAAMAVLSYLLFGERLKVSHAIGVGLAVMGVLAVNCVAPTESSAEAPFRSLGNLLVCGAVAGEGLFLLLRKKVSSDLSNISLAAILCVLGLAMSLPIAIYEGWGFQFSAVRPLEWAAILYFAVVFTVIAYILWFRGVARVSGSTAGVFTALIPVSALTLSYVFLGEKLQWTHLAGGALVLAAVLVVSLSSNTSGEELST